MINNTNEITEFLTEYPYPAIITVPTLKEGYVTCIKPIYSICGPELHVNGTTRPELNMLIQGIRSSESTSTNKTSTEVSQSS